MEAFINQLIQDQKKLYSENYHQVVRDYNEEVGTVKGYNGRQLLELLQNCDDEGSEEVLIELDTALQTISISNNGTPFSEKGYRSLFIANLSPKSATRKYIGNKGLGFRSIINWSNAIEIQSNSLSLHYSEQNRIDNFSSLYSSEFTEQIRTEYGFAETVFPMPFLSIPALNELKQDGFVTTIKIFYKQLFLQDILDQVKNITAETLLFLRSIQEVKFVGFADRENIICLKESINAGKQGFLPRQQVVYEGSSWEIFEEDNALPIEFADSDKRDKEHYQIKIAVEEKLRQNTPFLYSFFPTNIRLSQPYILHATFDLDATRNQIVNTAKNKYILAQVVNFTIQVAKFYAAQKVSYRPLQILKHIHFADSLTNLGYYQLINAAIAREPVFPCIDDTYKTMEMVVYVDDDFANMLMDFDATQILDCHLIPIDSKEVEKAIPLGEIDKSISVFENSLDIINEIAALPLSINQRALFIKKLVRDCSFLKTSFPNQVNVLTKKNGDIINGTEYIYTPITQGEELATPGFTNIQFINKDLFDQLVIQLEYKPAENAVKSRFIYDKLKGFCNIHSYEPTTLALKIISETNNVIKEFPDKADELVREMNNCLYFNYQKTDDDSKKMPIQVKVPTIAKSKKIKVTENVSLSNDYPTGIKTTLIFENIFDENNYLGSPKNNGIDVIGDIQEVENYFLWLGVNKFVKYNKDNTIDKDGYFNYIKKAKNISDSTGSVLKFIDIINFHAILDKIEINKLILWIHYDEELKKQISNTLNEDIVKNFYRREFFIYDKPSFIKFNIDTKYRVDFKNLLIDERYDWVNDININYRANEFLDNGLKKTNINEILVLLGAKDDFNNISTSKVADIINKIAIQFPDGKKSQSFYKKALNHYKLNRKTLIKPLNLFADNGSGLKLYPQKEVYFNDKIKLPKRLKKDYPIFNFPVRAGGAEAIKFFGINDLKIVQVEIISHNPLEEFSHHFNNYLDKLKPIILTYRINVIEDYKQRKIQASICNRIKIILCSEIKYKVHDNEYDVADYEFLHYDNDTYFIKVKDFDSISNLRKNFNFIESFSDILSLSFDISGEKNEFKYIIRDDFDYVLQNVKNDFGDDTFQEARELLGLTDYKHAFWQAVFEVKYFQYLEHIDDLSLENLITENFGIVFNPSDLDYENINEEVQLRKVEALFDSLGIELEAFSKKFLYKISMQIIHLSFIKNCLLSKKKIIKSTIWKLLSEKDVESQAKFLSEINKFEDFEDFARNYSLENEFKFTLNPEAVFQEYINTIYGEITIIEEMNIDKFKNQNLKEFNDIQKFEISQSERYKSLIYFKNAIETLKKELEKDELEAKQILEVTKGKTNNESVDIICPVIIDSAKLKPKNNSSKTKGKNKSVYTPKAKDEKKLKEIGNSSEKFVYDFLLNNPDYKDVYLASEDNEGLHYDIRYTDNQNVVKYVEVKTFDNGFFHLTKSEYDFGVNNKEDYEIWLVNDKKNIIPIKDFFTNNKYEVLPNEFLVYLEISMN